MATVRIKNITTTATSPSGDDFVAIDGATSNTRKIAAGPLGGVFDETIKTGSGTFPVAALAGIQIANGASSYSYFSATDDTKQFAAGIDHTLTEGVVGMISNHGLRIVTNNTERLRVDGSTGDVGIGVSDPSGYKLNVNGTAFFSGAVTADGNLEFNSGADLKLFHDSSNGYIQNVTGDLSLKNASAEYVKMLIATGGVELYHNGTKQCETSATGLSFPSGKGIDFSATGDGSGTMSSELLDDWEVGSWSPQLYSSGGTLTATMDVRSARYVKVGHKVTVMCYIRTSNVDNSSATGSLRISGLPYAVAGSDNYTAVSVGYAINWSTSPAGGYTETGNSNIILTRWSALGENLSASSPADLTNGSGTNNEVMLTATYCSF